ncbi:MAG: antitoxin [Spirochaeta sp.]|nr:antitoxin [Spirochaeta sp.]
MAILQVRDIDDALYEQLKRVAQQHRRSVSQEVMYVLEEYLAAPDRPRTNATEEFLKLSGSWLDDRPAQDIARTLRQERRNSSRFTESSNVFD